MIEGAGGRQVMLMRHGDCGAPEGHCVGQWDLPLTAAGAAQVAAVAAGWRGDVPERIVASDLQRARHSAELLGRYWSVPVACDARLREIDLGDWQGLSWQRIQREAPAALARWGQCWQEQGPPGGESARALLARVACWWQACLPGLPRTALVVGHAGSLRALLCQLGGRPAGALFECAVDCAAPFGLRR